MLRTAYVVLVGLALAGTPGRALAQSAPGAVAAVDAGASPTEASNATPILDLASRSGPSNDTPATIQAVEPVAVAPTVPMASFRSTMASVGGDFRRLFSPENARVAALLGSAALFAMHWDHVAVDEMRELPSSLFKPGNVAGALGTQVGIGLGGLVVGRATGRPKLALLGSQLIQAQVVSQALVQGMKLAAERGRPDASNHFSFPSGHTAGAFATATVLERMFGWKAGIPAYAFGSYVAAARMASNKHYLSDVMIGAAVGIVAGRAVAVPLGKATFDLGIAPTAGGAAVMFIKRN